MPLTSITAAKELKEGYQPLLLATFTFSDGTILRLSTHPLSVAQGGAQYGGNDYLCRIQAQDIEQVQSLSETGADLSASVRLTLADPDSYLYTNYELAHGFKGARVELRLVFCDVAGWTFSSDSRIPFVGTCEKPGRDAVSMTVAATARNGLTRAMFPIVPIQPRCPWLNPDTTAKRSEASNEDSPYYECGETRDLTTAPPCSYTKATCTQANRFGGITYTPPAGQRVREYTSGQWADVKSNANEAKYGDHFPMLYGTAWVEPPVMNVIPDGNYVRGECVVAVGEIGGIYRVVVNGVELSAANQQDGTPYSYVNKDFRWHWINAGDRDGSPNADTPYNSTGDPYGSMAAIMFVVPRSTAGDGIPRVRVLAQGPKIRVYTDGSTYTKVFSENPVWVLLDLLTWAGTTYVDCDLPSFVAAATKVSARPCAIVLRQRRAAQEIIRGLRQAFGLTLSVDHSSGKLRLGVLSTLADEQPGAIAESNYASAVSSVLPDGTAANGYVAYRFTSSSILRRDNPSSLRELPTAAQDSPTKIGIQFQDRTADYAGSSLTLTDADAVGRLDGQEVSGSLAVQPEGLTSLADAMRAGRVALAEMLRGNEAGDARGTRRFEFETTFRALHIRVGHLIQLTDANFGLSNQLCRVLRVQPTTNYETVKLIVQWHDDTWYTDAYASTGLPAYTDRRRDRLARPAFAWMPNEVGPQSGDSLRPISEKTFALSQSYTTAADGSRQAVLTINGKQPVNAFSTVPPPTAPLQGTTNSTGGTIPGDRVLYVAICSKDSDGKYSVLSPTIRIDIPSGTNTNTATASGLAWPTGATGHAVFAGVDPNRMSFQSEAGTTPSSVTLTALTEAAWGAPDVEFDSLIVAAKRVAVAGVLVAAVSSRTANTITKTSAGWTTNEWADRDITILTGDGVPVLNATIASNTADTLTLAGGSPSLVDGGVVGGDVFVIRAKPTVSGAQLTDSKWSLGSVVGKLCRIIGGAGRGILARITAATSTSITLDSDGSFDSTTRPIIEEPDVIYSSLTGSLENSDPATPLSIDVVVGNLESEILIVEAIARDGGGNESPLNPVREIYITGESGGISVGTANAPTNPTATINSYGENFTFDCAWTPPSPMGGTSAYEFEYEVYSDDEGATTVQPYSALMMATGGSTATKESSEITQPTEDRWARFRIRGVNAINEASAWVESPIYALPKRTSASVVDPVAPSTVSLTISAVGDRQYKALPSWTLPGDVGGNKSYVRQYSFDAGSTWLAPGEAFGANATSDIDGPWDRPETTANLRVRVAGKNADNTISAWVSSSDQSVTGYADATPPEATQPGSGDWSIGTLESRTTDQAGIQWCGIPITCTIPADAAYVQVWAYRGASPPASPSLYRDVMAITQGTGAQTETWWVEKEEAAYTLQLVVTASTTLRTTFPGAATPVKSVTVPALSLAGSLTSTSTEAVSYTVNGSQHYRLRFNGTYGTSDLNLAYIVARWHFTDSDYLNPGEWITIWYGGIGREVTGSPFSVFQPDPPWPIFPTAANHYVQVELGSQNWSGEINWTGVKSDLYIGGDNKVSAAALKDVGSGLDNSSGTLKSLDRTLRNGDFEDGLAGWQNNFPDTITVESTGGVSGSKWAKHTPDGALMVLTQQFPIVPGQAKKISAQLKNTTAGNFYLVATVLNSGGTPIAEYSTYVAPGTTNWTPKSVYVPAVDATAAYLQVYTSLSAASGSGVSAGIDCIAIEDLSPAGDGMTRSADGALMPFVGPGIKIDGTFKYQTLQLKSGQLKTNASLELEVDKLTVNYLDAGIATFSSSVTFQHSSDGGSTYNGRLVIDNTGLTVATSAQVYLSLAASGITIQNTASNKLTISATNIDITMIGASYTFTTEIFGTGIKLKYKPNGGSYTDAVSLSSGGVAFNAACNFTVATTFQANVGFSYTPTVGGVAVSLAGHTHSYASTTHVHTYDKTSWVLQKAGVPQGDSITFYDRDNNQIYLGFANTATNSGQPS